jgi:hypothetical protein
MDRQREQVRVSRTGIRPGKAFVAAGTLVVFCLGGAPVARATLGGDVASIAANERELLGVRHVQKLASGERHDLTLPSGIVVHEYLSAGGVVYALTWRGPRMPDLRELLGPYFAELGGGATRMSGGHHRVTRVGSDLVIRSSGHRGSFAGRAWVPSLVPSGIHVEAALE